MQHSGSGSQIVEFPREIEGLPEARTTELIELTDGDEFDQLRRARLRQPLGLARELDHLASGS